MCYILYLAILSKPQLNIISKKKKKKKESVNK